MKILPKMAGTYIVPTRHAPPLRGVFVQLVPGGKDAPKRIFLEPQFKSDAEAIRAGERLAASIRKRAA
ncbi:hypothetical protein [Falsiroseomonas sp. CW058]|uniref:hypothetical protein n=1 Tax=Falsiroseomonas sp. CW058 TaxID=3388664 RepID=UPI003D3166B1